MNCSKCSCYSFLQIAEIYSQAGKHDQGLDWAEKELRAFSDFLSNEYHRRGRHTDAMDLIWAQFTEVPQLDTHKKLQAHAKMSDKLQFVATREEILADNQEDALATEAAATSAPDSKLGTRKSRRGHRQTEACRTSEWSSWREKALTHLRALTKVRTRSEQRAQPKYYWQHEPDHSRLVEIFLWEKSHEEAWQEATAGGCSQYLWLQLADAVAKDHPDRSLPIYQELIAPTLARTNNVAYHEAIKLLGKMRQAMTRLDRATEFEDYLTALRVDYKRKRNFIKLLDKLSK